VARNTYRRGAIVDCVPLPISPPLAPMLARLERSLPTGDFLYEPKWDGFRCIAFCASDGVDLRSRHDRPLGRYFPELTASLASMAAAGMVLDGEIVLSGPNGFDFAALMLRLHPARSRVARLSAEQPARFVAFDLLADIEEDLTSRPFAERRRRLEERLQDRPPRISLTPATGDSTVAAEWLERFRGGGVDGVMAKPLDAPYQPGRRAMIKVKHERTVDCVVAGYRFFPGQRAISSLILGLYDEACELRHVGVVTNLPAAERRALIGELSPLRVPLDQHPWRSGFGIARSPIGRLLGSASRWTPEMEHDWVPLRPHRVVEVAVTAIDVDRFRHPARLRRWRPDREAKSCTMDQLRVGASVVEELLAGASDP
jgi:ATP-dependent DNA ligase